MEVIYGSIIRIKSLLQFIIQDSSKLADHPVYIYFLNSQLNTIPKFLTKNTEVGIVIQKQFKDFSIGNRYLEVVLFFSGEPHVLNIDLLTIFSVEILDINKYTCEYKKSTEYLSIINKIGHEEYNKNIADASRTMFSHTHQKTDAGSSTALVAKVKDLHTVMTNIDELVKGINQ